MSIFYSARVGRRPPSPPRLDETSLLSGLDEPSSTKNPAAVQARILGLQRDYISEALRIAALKAAHAADDCEIADDAAVERGIRLALQNLREAPSAFRELQKAGG